MNALAAQPEQFPHAIHIYWLPIVVALGILVILLILWRIQKIVEIVLHWRRARRGE